MLESTAHYGAGAGDAVGSAERNSNMTSAMAGPTVARELVTQVPIVMDRIALIDSRGIIVAVNNNWMALAEETGAALNRVGPGVNYLEVCRQASGSSAADAREALSGIRAVLKEKVQSFTMDYACHTPVGQAYFRMLVTPISYRDARVAIAHHGGNRPVGDFADAQIAGVCDEEIEIGVDRDAMRLAQLRARGWSVIATS